MLICAGVAEWLRRRSGEPVGDHPAWVRIPAPASIFFELQVVDLSAGPVAKLPTPFFRF